jgi:iron complex outermembrane receptor protein
MFHTILLSINLASSIGADSLPIPLLRDSLKEDIVIRAYRATDNQPITQYTFEKKEIKEKYYGQDISFLLQQTPSVVAQSDAGNMMGYSYFRIRGIDYTRINFGINGIPVNDPENQGFFANNFADLASSAQSIQIQRGVGTSSNGTAPVGGSVNIVTQDLNSPKFISAGMGYGSFNSSRIVAELNTGVLKNGLAIYARGSYLKSDGYRQNSATDLKTFFFSVGKFGKKSILKFNAFGGATENQLSFFGVPSDKMAIDRRFNPLQNDEKDQFRQFFYQLQYIYKFNPLWNISSSAYYVKGVAPMFAMRFNSFPFFFANMPNAIANDGTELNNTNMLVSYRLNQDFIGGMSAVNFKNEKIDFSFGLHANHFVSDHLMEILRADIFPQGFSKGHLAYFNTGYKNEFTNFAKLSINILPQTSIFLDYQMRIAMFRYSAQDKPIFRDTFKVDNMQWVFFNPKIGMKHRFNDNFSVYGSFGVVSREPTRFDFLGDDRANFNVKQSDVKPETVYNTELGVEYKTESFKANLNLYLMEFRNEIAATGALNSFGYAIRSNVKQSFRRGAELSFLWNISPVVALYNQSAFSINRIKEVLINVPIVDSNFVNTYTTQAVSYQNVNPVLTPQSIVNQGIIIKPISWLSFDVSGRYVGKMYLDNSNNENLTTPAFFVADARASIQLRQWIKFVDASLSLQANNFTNTLYSPAGTPYNVFVNAGESNTIFTSPSFFPAATRNFFVSLNVKIP